MLAWEFCIEKRRGFLVNVFWSPFPAKRSTKNPQKIRGKIRGKIRDKKFEKFGELSLCKFSGLKVRPQFWGRKWLCQFYGHLAFFGSFCWKPHAHKIPPFRGGCWGFLEGGGEVPILFLWAWGFFRFCPILPFLDCLDFLGWFLPRIFLAKMGVFSRFSRVLCVRQGKKILGKFGGFPWWKQNNQGKEEQGKNPFT